MKSLKEEAQEYAVKVNEKMDGFKEVYQTITVIDFVAGANSNYVQVEKLKAQIEVLEKVYSNMNGNINNQIYNLKQQLKEL